MGLSMNMMRAEQRRQRERWMRNHNVKPGGLVGVAKDQVKPLVKDDPEAAQYLCAFDCTCCKQRFVWDTRQPLKACPLCDAGAKQKANKLPTKRKTHKQKREIAARLKEHKLKAAFDAINANVNTPAELEAAGIITEPVRIGLEQGYVQPLNSKAFSLKDAEDAHE